MTAARLPEGYNRFYLRSLPGGEPWPTSLLQLVLPAGTTYTFTVSTTERAASSLDFQLHAATAVVVTTAFQVPPPLTFELTSSRDLCTANTLTELSWIISGGRPPYTLNIDGETVDANAESHRANCGPLPTDPFTNDPLPDQTKMFSANVSDSQATVASTVGEVTVDLSPPLPKPSDLYFEPRVGRVDAWWEQVRGAGSQFPEEAFEGYAAPPAEAFLVRWRARDAAAWRYTVGKPSRSSDAATDWQRPGLGIFEMQVAAMRHPLEAETPAALSWSDKLTYSEFVAPENVIVSATYDMVTVSWDRQPYTGRGYVSLRRGNTESIVRGFVDTTATGRLQAVFPHLPPATEYRVEVVKVAVEASVRTVTTVRTAAAPSDYEPPTRGPQNLRATTTHDRITIRWDEPFAGAEPTYLLQVFDKISGSKVDWRWVYGKPFEYTARGLVGRLRPATTYRIQILHLAIPEIKVVIEATTASKPASGQERSPGAGSLEPWFNLKTLRWPVRIAEHHILTDDPFEWRDDHFHAAVDIGERGQQITVVTAAPLPADYTRFYLQRQPLQVTVSPTSSEQLIPPVGTTYTFTATNDERGSTLLSFDLTAARPLPISRPGIKPELGDVVVTTAFQVETTTLRYHAYATTGAVTTAGSYAFLSDPADTTSAVSTYEGLRDGATTGLLIHKSDTHGASQAALYDAVEADDLFEWRHADDCWVRYTVTEVKPDPTGIVPRKLLAVEWMTYAFTGCSGAVSTNVAASFAWGDLPDVGGASLTTPVVHGPFQIMPEGWTGATQEPVTRESAGYSYSRPTGTTNINEARQLPFWRDPTLPEGATLDWARSGDISGPVYGYTARFRGSENDVTIYGYDTSHRRQPEKATWLHGRGARETRVIAGRPAVVIYSPLVPSHDDLFPVAVWVYDPASEATYEIWGLNTGGSNIEGVITIARSLFEPPDPAATRQSNRSALARPEQQPLDQGDPVEPAPPGQPRVAAAAAQPAHSSAAQPTRRADAPDQDRSPKQRRIQRLRAALAPPDARSPVRLAEPARLPQRRLGHANHTGRSGTYIHADRYRGRGRQHQSPGSDDAHRGRPGHADRELERCDAHVRRLVRRLFWLRHDLHPGDVRERERDGRVHAAARRSRHVSHRRQLHPRRLQRRPGRLRPGPGHTSVGSHPARRRRPLSGRARPSIHSRDGRPAA